MFFDVFHVVVDAGADLERGLPPPKSHLAESPACSLQILSMLKYSCRSLTYSAMGLRLAESER
jgi:hypothetical protein